MNAIDTSVWRACAVCLALLGCSLACAEDWVDVRLPPGAQSQGVATHMVFNGRPCRLLQFDVQSSEQAVLAFFRSAYRPAKTVENRVHNQPVIAVRLGEFFLTAQLQALDDHTVRGRVMTTRVSGPAVSSSVQLDTQRLLPVDTLVMSTIQSTDDKKQSLLLVGTNQHSVRANRDQLHQRMGDQGFQLNAEEVSPPGAALSAITLLLSARSEEAAVTISDAGSSRAVLINRVKETP